MSEGGVDEVRWLTEAQLNKLNTEIDDLGYGDVCWWSFLPEGS